MLGFEEGAKVSIDAAMWHLKKHLVVMVNLQKLNRELARTLGDYICGLGDELFNFQKLIVEQFIGTFDELGDLKQFFEENKKEIQEIATAIGISLVDAILILGKHLLNQRCL